MALELHPLLPHACIIVTSMQRMVCAQAECAYHAAY